MPARCARMLPLPASAKAVQPLALNEDLFRKKYPETFSLVILRCGSITTTGHPVVGDSAFLVNIMRLSVSIYENALIFPSSLEQELLSTLQTF